MLGTIRKFSNSIFAKIFLFIVAIPFVFWGMGDLFSVGNKNTIVKIGKDKISTKEFVNYINNNATLNQVIDDSFVENSLYSFIGEKLIEKEINNFKIILSKNSLGKIIKNQDAFKRKNEFSRTEYEKFLVENSIDAVTFEKNILLQEKKKQLFNYIGGGLIPTNFLINLAFDKENQKRSVQIVSLEEALKEELKFNDNQIESYYKKNKNNFKKTYKSFKFIELNSKNLTETDEFTNLFFKKIDEIDDLIVEEKKIEFIIDKYNLQNSKIVTFDEFGNDKEYKKVTLFDDNFTKSLFNILETEPTILLEHKEKYFIFELIGTEIIQRQIGDKLIRKEILNNLKKEKKRNLISVLLSKINSNNFNKKNFDEYISAKNLNVKKIRFENKKDNREFKKNFLDQIYFYPEKKVIIVTDIGLSESYLVYIDKIENVSISENSEEYAKYSNLAKLNLTNSMYNTYDNWIKKKYKIDINYQALQEIKNIVK